jgi:peptidyl-prolyl cis-trans isomerase D
MAVLEKIRKRGGVLVAVIIGLALVSFILGDMFRAGDPLFGSSKFELAKIDGKSVNYQDFQERVESLAEVYRISSGQTTLNEEAWSQLREQAWDDLLHETIMFPVYEELGITVSSEELFDIVQGDNIHPYIQQIFQNPETGEVDRKTILSFLKNMENDPSGKQQIYWLNVEKQITKEELQKKYNTLIQQGLYFTIEEVQKQIALKRKKLDIAFIALNYVDVPDSLIVCSENDLRDYYKKHIENYTQEKSRKIEYISYEVVASATDDTRAREWINAIKNDFKHAEDNEPFVNMNSDTPFDRNFYKSSELSPQLRKFVFSSKKGAVLGPYKDSASYKLAKVHQFKLVPDRVKARHILIQVRNREEYNTAMAKIDSIKERIKSGEDFSVFAKKVSADKSSAVNGGDLGWFKKGDMVKPFSDACFYGDIWELQIVVTQFGVHLVQVTQQESLTEQVQVAVIERKVTPSTETYQRAYTKAMKFAGEHTTDRASFLHAIKTMGLSKQEVIINNNDKAIPEIERSAAHELVKAAYQAKEGDILLNEANSPVFEVGNTFIIASLAKVKEDKYQPFEDVKFKVKLAVMKEKKAELLTRKASKAREKKSSLEAIAKDLATTVKKATDISFSSISLPGMGFEPSIIGAALALDTNLISLPVKGNNAVYLLQVSNSTEKAYNNVFEEKEVLQQNLASRVNTQSYQTHRNAVEIVDKRINFRSAN